MKSFAFWDKHREILVIVAVQATVLVIFLALESYFHF